MERVVTEFRIIETDDGYRIEIKGDKESIRSMFDCAGFSGTEQGWRPHEHWFRVFGPRFWRGFRGFSWSPEDESKKR